MSEVLNSTTAQDTPNAVNAENNAAPVDAGQKLYPEGEQNKAASANETPAAEIKYDLKLPEGSNLDNTWLEEWTNLAKEQKLSNEQAQKLLEKESLTVKSFFEAQQQQQQEQRNAWAESVKADKEIGGEQLQANVNLAKQALTKFGSEALMKELEATGYGNHPEVIRVFAKIGKALNPQGLVTAGTQAGPQKKSLADVFYPNN